LILIHGLKCSLTFRQFTALGTKKAASRTQDEVLIALKVNLECELRCFLNAVRHSWTMLRTKSVYSNSRAFIQIVLYVSFVLIFELSLNILNKNPITKWLLDYFFWPCENTDNLKTMSFQAIVVSGFCILGTFSQYIDAYISSDICVCVVTVRSLLQCP
jgi:hypothetical protein